MDAEQDLHERIVAQLGDTLEDQPLADDLAGRLNDESLSRLLLAASTVRLQALRSGLLSERFGGGDRKW